MANFLDKVLLINPKTGQQIEATQKQYDSIYKDKGFELVGRGSTSKPINGKKAKGPQAGENIGSAAEIANRLGVGTKAAEGGPPEPPAKGSHVDPASGKRVVGERPPEKQLPNEAKTNPTAAGNAAEGVNAGGNAESGVAGSEGSESNVVDPNANEPDTKTGD